MTNLAEIKAIRNKERLDLVETLKEQLIADRRIQAAWVAGSIARGDDDWLSDIDIYVVATDNLIDEIVSDRHAFVANTVAPDLTMDMMKNAPPNGAYLLVHYRGRFGPQHVDWYWQPETGANKPDNGLLLFDRANLPVPVINGEEWAESMNQTGGGAAIESTDTVDLANQNFEYFWAMALIVSKYIVRGDRVTAEYMLNMIVRTLDKIGEQLDIDVPKVEPFKFDSNSSTAMQFESLHAVAVIAKSIEANAVAKHAKIPSKAIEQIEAFFDVCEQATR